MFSKLLEDVVDVAANVAKVAVAPVAVTAAAAKQVTKPIAEAASDVVDAVRDELP
jgi:hypothetical protein